MQMRQLSLKWERICILGKALVTYSKIVAHAGVLPYMYRAVPKKCLFMHMQRIKDIFQLLQCFEEKTFQELTGEVSLSEAVHSPKMLA